MTYSSIWNLEGFIDKFPAGKDEAILIMLLSNCYKYSAAIINQTWIDPFPAEPLKLLLLQKTHQSVEGDDTIN